MAKGPTMDFSSFMCVILMLIGVLMILLISNVVTIISNPENVQISAVVHNAMYDENKGPNDQDTTLVPKFNNKSKEPTYIDVYRDRLVLYPDESVVPAGQIIQPGNRFEQVLKKVAAKKDREYIILLARPGSASMVRRLRRAIHDKQVDVGFELYEANRPVDLKSAGETPEPKPKPAPEPSTNTAPAAKAAEGA